MTWIPSSALLSVAAALILIASIDVGAQSLYKYRGPDGEWVYTDREPAGDAEIEVRELARGTRDPRVSVAHRELDGGIALFATNEYYAPVQVVVGLEELEGFERLDPEQSLRFVVGARSESFLLRFTPNDSSEERTIRYRYAYVIGDPAAEHDASHRYRAPFAVAGQHTVSQAYPDAITHTTLDSAHAVDFAMPIGTDIYAARGGVVFDVASNNYRGGTDTSIEGAQANIVSILHDDGTYAIYAHLNWNSIRVQPGDRVRRGEYIADSGNTGFSSGPHLHFVVIKNADMRSESVPVTFEGPNGAAIVPERGVSLTAY